MSSNSHHNMSSTSDDNTDVAVIGGTSSPTNHAQDAQGRPTIGKIFYINRGRGKDHEDEASTLSSISGGITNISKAQFGVGGFPEQYDVESGVAIENNTFEVIYGRENSYTDDKSSLSSLTDNFPSKGRFAQMKGTLATFGFQTQLANIVDTSPSREKKDPNISPWYLQSSQNIEINAIPTLGQGSDNASSSSSSSINNIPEKELKLMTSFTKDHLDDLVRYPPPKPPPLQRLSSSFHRRASDLDSSRAGRSEGFLTYVQEQYILSRRKKLISVVVVVFFVCIIVIVAVAFNTQNNRNVNEEEANATYQVEQPHERKNDTLSSAGNSGYYNDTLLEDLSSVEHDNDTEDVSNDTSTTAAVILTTDPTKQIPQDTESAATSTMATNSSQAKTTTTTTTTTTSETPSTSTDPTTPGWLDDLSALVFTTAASTTTTTSTTTSTQKTPTVNPTSKPTFRPSISPSISSKESPITAPALSSLSIKAISDTTIFENRPTKNFASTSYLAVKNNAKASSFVRFDISNTSGNTVSKAILRLYSISVTNTDNDVIGGLSSISVDSLPLAGKWNESTITYDTQAELADAFTVGSFSVEDYPYSESNRLQRVHEVDVTAAFHNPADAEGFTTVSFMLYSDETSTGRVDFASNEWGEGFNGPELVIEYSPSTGSSTSTSSSVPSTIPSTTPSNECTVKCEEDAIEKLDREIDKLVDKCIEDTAFNENCIQDAKKCKKECKKDAEKREEDVLEKVNNDAIKCKEICQNNAPDDTPLAVDHDVVVVVNNKLSKRDKSAPDATEFRLMELFP